MQRNRTGWWLCGLLVLGGVLGLAASAGANEEVLFGPVTYTRTAGWLDQFHATIPLPPTLGQPFRLHVQNGDADGPHQDEPARRRSVVVAYSSHRCRTPPHPPG